MLTARDWLRQEFVKRKQKNARYSLRSFSQFLKLSSGEVSELLAGKRPFSTKKILQIADRFLTAPAIVNELLVASSTTRKEPDSNKSKKEKASALVLQDDVFSYIASWQHYAILNLTKTKNFKADTKKIARRLSISEIEASDAVDRLLRLGMLQLRNGKLERACDNLKTTVDIPSAAIRKFHNENLQNAINAIESVPVTRREYSSITMAMNIEDLEAAKKMLRDFRARFVEKFSQEKNATDVFQFNTQFLPLTSALEEK